MINNYFKIAVRNILRYKLFSLINIMGLSVGIACSILTLLNVRFELSFDKFHENLNEIFQLQQTVVLDRGEYLTDRGGGAYARAIQDKFPEIVSTVRLDNPGELLFNSQTYNNAGIARYQNNENIVFENNGLATDSTFFDIFSFPLLQGDPHEALKNPYSIVITEKLAKRHFGDNNPMGEIIRINNEFDFYVSGVARDVPLNSHLQFEFIIQIDFLVKLGREINQYGGTHMYTYVQLFKNADYKKLSVQINDYLHTVHEPDLETRQFLVPLEKVHLHGEDHLNTGVLLFIIISALILLIACINFMNLSTARSIYRTKEVGIRKVNGANRVQLIGQFLGESLILAFIAMNIAIIIVELSLGMFNTLVGKNLSIEYNNIYFLMELLGIVVITGLIAGSYPAFHLSSRQTVKIIRNPLKYGGTGGSFRKILIVFQFTFSVIFIILSVFVSLQTSHLKNVDTGIKKDNIIYMPVRGEIESKYDIIKEELLRNQNIDNVSTSSSIPTFITHGEVEWGDQIDVNNPMARVCWAGYDFSKTFDLDLIEGRFFSENYADEQNNSIVVNEDVVSILGLESPIGSTFYLYNQPYTIIGVIKNFNFFPLSIVKNEALIIPFSKVENYMFIRINKDKFPLCEDFIEQLFVEFNPAFPYEYNFLDEYEDPIMKATKPAKTTAIFFTILGIFISCLGLFGLSAFNAEKMVHEIGVRKTMGATVSQIISIMTKILLKQVIIAILIGSPIAYILIRLIGQMIINQINYSIWIFIFSAIIILTISILTVLWQAIKAANSNTIDSLRYE